MHSVGTDKGASDACITVLIVMLLATLSCGDPPETDPRKELRRRDREDCMLAQIYEMGKEYDEAYDNCQPIMELPLSNWDGEVGK